MVLIIFIYFISIIFTIKSYFSLRKQILCAGVISFAFTAIHFYECDSPLIVSDSEYFMMQVDYFDQIPISKILTKIDDYLFEFYSLLISVLFRFSNDKVPLILSLHVILYFITIARIVELIRSLGKGKYEGIILTILITSFLNHLFVPQILREMPIVFCVVSFFLGLSRKSKRSILIYSLILTLFHGGFVLLFILSVLRVLHQSKGTQKVIFASLVLLTIILFSSRGVSVYKLSFTPDQMKDFEYLSQQTTGGLGNVLDGAYRKEYQISSITGFFTFYIESMYYFILKPFFFERVTISYPQNFYKSSMGIILLLLLLRNIYYGSLLKTEYLFLLVTISVFAISTSQYGQAIRHFSKFYSVLLVYILSDFYQPNEMIDRSIFTGIVYFNISFFLLHLFSILV
jgi:hypothetical protein